MHGIPLNPDPHSCLPHVTHPTRSAPRSSMQKFRELVSGSFTQLWEELRKHKDEFLSRLSAVGQQQQQLIEKQNAMDDRLKLVRRRRYS